MTDFTTVAVALSIPLLREGIVLVLRDASIEVLEVVSMASELQRPESADVAVVAFDGSETACAEISDLRCRAPDLRIVGIHDGQPPHHLELAQASGASILIDVTSEATTLVEAIRGDRDRTLRRWAPPRVGRVPLNARERDVLTHIARGASSREAAEQLCLKPHAVERLMQDLLRKLGASNQAQAVAVALRDGLLDGDSDGVTST